MITLIFTGLSYFLWEKNEWRQKVKLFMFLILSYLSIKYYYSQTEILKSSDIYVYKYFFENIDDKSIVKELNFEYLYIFTNMVFKWIGIKDFYFYFLFLQGIVSYLVLKILNKRGYQRV